MEVNQILNCDVLDIIFDGRNKDYGAYELRKTYNNRLAAALVTTGGMIVTGFLFYIYASSFPAGPLQKKEIDDVKFVELKTDPVPDITPPPKSRPDISPAKTINNSPPLIVHYDVKEEQQSPDLNQLNETRIGTVTQAGLNDDVVDALPVADDKRGIVSPPKSDVTNNDGLAITVEIESTYPGGTGAWMRYLNKTFKYPAAAQEMNIQGTVTVQFIVDKEGNVSNVEAIDGPTNGGLRDEAVRVIRKSGKWEPAIQNGRKVKSYKRQPITFRLEAQ